MTKGKQKLYDKAVQSPSNLTFNELCKLAEKVGFIHRNTNGDHKIYKHPYVKGMMNFQPDKKDKKKAKSYQVAQLISFIVDNKLIKEGK